MNEDSDTSRLIRLKRYEQPSESYFESFLAEFQKRQRSELLQRSTRSIFFERLATYAADFGNPRALAAAGAFCLFALASLAVFRILDTPATGPAGAIAGTPKQEIPSPPPLLEPLPLPEEIVNGPLEIYPVGIQKVGASYYILQEPPIRSRVAPENNRSGYRLPAINLDGNE